MVQSMDKIEQIVHTTCWLHNVLLGYDYNDDDDVWLAGIDDEDDDLDDDNFCDPAVNSMMHPVLQEWCGCENDDGQHDEEETLNMNLTRFRI